MFLGGDREKKRNVCFVVEVDEEEFMMCWYFIEKKEERTRGMWVWGLYVF
jgi:hypothetical protein